MDDQQHVSYPRPNCPDCGSSLRLVVEKNDWYCDSCKKFPKVHSEIPSDMERGTKKGRKQFWLYYVIAIIAVLIWFFVSGFRSNDPFERTAYTIGIIVVIIAIPISYLITKYVLSKK